MVLVTTLFAAIIVAIVVLFFGGILIAGVLFIANVILFPVALIVRMLGGVK